jgi:hypothetical protein
MKQAGYLAEVAAGFIPAKIDENADGWDKPRRYSPFNIIGRIP